MRMKRALAVSAVTAAAVLSLKLYAFFALADASAGFYSDGGRLALCALILAAAGSAAAFLLAKRAGVPGDVTCVSSAPAGALASLTGAAVALESVLGLLGRYPVSAEAQASLSVTVTDNLFFIAGFPAAVVFFLAARDLLNAGNFLRRHPLAALLPPVWGCFGMIALFIDYAAAVNRIENVYHTFTAATLLLFLFSQAKTFSNVDGEKGRARLFPFGFAAVVFAVTDSVPNAVLLCCGRTPMGSFPEGLYFVNLALAMYAAAYLAAVRRTLREKKAAVSPAEILLTPEEPAAEQPQAARPAEAPEPAPSAPEEPAAEQPQAACPAEAPEPAPSAPVEPAAEQPQAACPEETPEPAPSAPAEPAAEQPQAAHPEETPEPAENMLAECEELLQKMYRAGERFEKLPDKDDSGKEIHPDS